ncbi:protein jag [Lottiidibacillus patelloidae]|uniref:RNA-binding protein KhpB n=1 Tax=Lottiidibacillus patelloidae TaxID=2670334 RepID=A0A263BT65_9BACI|nr:RNA-binding cell elongation regulator Jag/EloR [Lottiidibacillus patelloidae]OZM56567.1 protein jag [Lottiidibacillus patelloidae]
MSEVTVAGKTVEDAIRLALEQLETTEDRLTIDVIEEGKKGFLGFGSKEAVIKATLIKDPIEEATKFLQEVTEKMGAPVTITTSMKQQYITFNLSGEKIALLIGKRGATLNALQNLTNLVANRYSKQYVRVILDAENYREKRKQSLELLADKLAKNAVRFKKKVHLEPMPSIERKVIHTALQNRHDVETTSEGVEPNRRVVIIPNR